MKHRNNLKRFLYLDFYYSVLRRDWRISTFLSDLVLKTVAVVIVSIDRFIKDASMISASALTFYSTLSFIPVVALILAIARGFGAAKAFEDWLKEQSYTNPDVMQWVMNIANKALDNTQGGVIAGFGIVLLLWSVIQYRTGYEPDLGGEEGTESGKKIYRLHVDSVYRSDPGRIDQ